MSGHPFSFARRLGVWCWARRRATVCYIMNLQMTHRGRAGVGVRELRQNLSVYLDRVKLGKR